MTTDTALNPSDPYAVPSAGAVAGGVLEATITTSLADAVEPIVSGSMNIHAETYNGTIPGPTLFLSVGNDVIVRLVNNLPYDSGIHWHGIELTNSADGTPVTQNGVAGAPLQTLGNGVPAGGTYLYKFKVPRPGIYWYHPHHHHSTNRVIRGTYGMIVVTEDIEGPLKTSGVLPSDENTKQLVLSDITVCKAGTASDPNDTETYVDPTTLPAGEAPEWLSGGTSQAGPTPATLCELPTALQEDGSLATAAYDAGDVPNIQRAGEGRTNEGQIVLTNGVNVGGRKGTPAVPAFDLDPGAYSLDVNPGQGLRLQIVNCATTRYMRLRLTNRNGDQIPLFRIGGEGGLLDNPVLDGGVIGGFDTKYDLGEVVLPPASRADVVVAIPATPASDMLTLWTRDYSRTGGGFSGLPTVPVMHLNVSGTAVSPAYTIDTTTELRTAPALVEDLDTTTGSLLNPADFTPTKFGMDDQDIQLTITGTQPNRELSINDIPGGFAFPGHYTGAPHIDSSRYAQLGDVLELTVTNTMGAHHPFHLHGFSFQPISLTRPGNPTYTWPYNEFRDNVDIPGNYTLTFRVRLANHKLADGTTYGGGYGRWLFHCHIFFHAHQGMISELVVTDSDGSEKPNVDVGGSWAYTPAGGIARRRGTFNHPDGDTVTLSASIGTVDILTIPTGPANPGTWSWELDTDAESTPEDIYYVYITATDEPDGRQDQTVFRLKVGEPDDGSDIGDPHIYTVDGKRYDFQSVGEFTLLRDREGMEIQARQTPVETANPITDPYSGLRACVSVNTAVAARVGSHRIAYQPSPQGERYEFFVDGKQVALPTEGIDFGAHRVTTFPAGAETGLRIDYEDHTVVTVSPRTWHNTQILDVRVSHTQADEGLMGRIPDDSWLPALPNGATVGPMPAALSDRHTALYKTFANAWRLTDQTSLFVYAPGTSTETFTDRDWPSDGPPCIVKPDFAIPGFPDPMNIDVEEAKRICQAVTEADLHEHCVFDVATTGDETFAEGYLVAQELRLRGSTVQIVGRKDKTQVREALLVTAIVLPMTGGRPTPRGSVTFLVDGIAASPPLTLEKNGRASHLLEKLSVGEHRIRADYVPEEGKEAYFPSSSPNLIHEVSDEDAGNGESTNPSQQVWIWVVLILVVLIALAIF